MALAAISEGGPGGRGGSAPATTTFGAGYGSARAKSQRTGRGSTKAVQTTQRNQPAGEAALARQHARWRPWLMPWVLALVVATRTVACRYTTPVNFEEPVKWPSDASVAVVPFRSEPLHRSASRSGRLCFCADRILHDRADA